MVNSLEGELIIITVSDITISTESSQIIFSKLACMYVKRGGEKSTTELK